MEAYHKEKASKTDASGELRWPDWIRAIQANSNRLREHLESEEWELLQLDIRERERLLRNAAAQLETPTDLQSTSRRCKSPSDIKMVLQEALDANQELADMLTTRRHGLKSKLGDISKGRKLLNLYKSHRQTIPRFFDKFG